MAQPAARILIADDQTDVVEALRLLFKSEGYRTEAVNSPSAVLELLRANEFDLLLMDLNYSRDTTSGEEGLDLLARVQVLDHSLPVVVMTAWASVELAVEAMRRGARDFIQKPWENARVLTIARTQIELRRALRKGQKLEAENTALKGTGVPPLIAESPSMRPVIDMISRVGPAEANVLITGENGSGKGLIAQWLHAQSARAGHALVFGPCAPLIRLLAVERRRHRINRVAGSALDDHVLHDNASRIRQLETVR